MSIRSRFIPVFAALAAGATLASAPAQAGDGRFADQGEHFELDRPETVATGDFNSDGRTDLAASLSNGGRVAVLLKAPGAGFVQAPNVPAGTSPRPLVVADFNADGAEDLATSSVEKLVRVRLGDGTGSFTNAPDVSLPRNARALAVGDFNGDNREDLAIAVYESGGYGVAVRLGAGNGTFTDGGDVSVRANSLAVGDFNSDNIEDLVYATPDGGAGVLLGTGGGTFAPGGLIELPGVAGGLMAPAVGDFNSDGSQDVAFAVQTKDVVSVRLGAGDGTFASAPDVPVGRSPTAPAVGDFDSDGDHDLAVTNDYGNSVSVRLSDGAGGFADAGTIPVDNGPLTLALADFDADGNDDLAVASSVGNGLSVLAGLGESPLAGNLLVNGGFEGRGAGSLHTQSPDIPGWERTGAMTYIRYGIAAHGFFPSRLASPRYNGGQNLLFGGDSRDTGGLTEAFQTVDVSGSAASIDAGVATANLSAYLGGALDVPDVMSARAEFLNADGGTIGSFEIGPVTVADRKRQTTLLRRSGTSPVPAGTRRIRVTLRSNDADKTYSSATADNVKLTLDAPDPPASPPAEPGDDQAEADREAPAIRGVKLGPARFGVARRATARSARRGTTIRYALSEEARVTLRFQRRSGRRWRTAGALKRGGREGANRVAFSGRLGRRALRRGSYRLIVSAVDAAGNRSAARPKRFRIVR